MFLSFIFLFLFAHEDLPSITCKLDKKKISIIKTQIPKFYEIKTPEMTKQTQVVVKPQTTDTWNEQTKQTLDAYTFKLAEKSLIVKRPETPGKIKKTMAYWEGKVFTCSQKK